MKRLVRFGYLLILIFGLFLTASLYGCGGGANSSYSLPEGNHALMGPLRDATVKIYRLSDLKTPVETATTGSLGSFKASLPGIPDNELLLVQVSGGYDIDIDDNGFFDSKPTANLGTISGYATAKSLKEGKTNITLLSEIVYEYSRHLIKDLENGTLSQSSFENILGYIASKLITSANAIQAYENVLSFNPLDVSSLDKLKFKYSLLITGKGCLASLYHKNDEENIPATLSKLFTHYGLVLNNALWFYTRNQVKVNVVWSSCISDISTKLNGQIVNPDNTTETQNQSFFATKGDNVTVTVNNIGDNYKILRWHGCDRVSDDKNTCYVYDIQKDRVITPVTVPSKITLSDNYAATNTTDTANYTIVDITGAYIKLPEAEDNSSIDLSSIPVNSPLLDNITAYASDDDNSTLSKLNSVKVGDVIVNKSDPIFFRKVTNIQAIKIDNGQKYEFTTQFIPLQDIIKAGYISTSANPAESGGLQVHVLKRSLILPDGREIQLNPDTQPKITIKFEDDKAYIYTGGETGWSYSTNIGPLSIGPIYLDNDKTTSIEGSLTIEPHIDVDMSWHIDWFKISLDYMYIAYGDKYIDNVTFNTTIEKKFGVSPTEIANVLHYRETVDIGGVPVVITETMPIIYGLKGPGTGEDEDEAFIKGELTANVVTTIDPTFSVVYNGRDTVSNLSFNPTLSGSIDAKVSAGAYAYIGAVPTLKVYFLGISMVNDLGPYAKLEAEASTDKDPDIKLNGEFGLGYYGRVQAMSDASFMDGIVDKINESIRGKYTEFWQPFPIKTFSYQSSIATPTGRLEIVSGPKELFYEKKWSDNLNETVNYTLKNSGSEAIAWQADIINHSGDILNVKLSSYQGELNPGETTTVTATISSQKLPANGGVLKAEIVFHKKTDYTTPSLPSPIIPIAVQVAPQIETNGELSTNLSINIVDATVKKLQFDWTPVDADIDGYEILYTNYDGTTGTCGDSYKKFASIDNKSASSYSNVIDYSKTEPGKQYCFAIFAYKSMGEDPNSRYLYPLLSSPVISPEIPLSLSIWQ